MLGVYAEGEQIPGHRVEIGPDCHRSGSDVGCCEVNDVFHSGDTTAHLLSLSKWTPRAWFGY